MTLNASGPISLAGTTAGQSIEIENGGNGTTQISLNDGAVRTLAGVTTPNSTITMPTNFYGKSNRVVQTITLSSSTANYTFNPAKISGYVAGKTCATLTINSGVYVYGTSTGTPALTIPNTWASGDVVKVNNSGFILGQGGAGGHGGNFPNQGSYFPGCSGGTGGTALSVSYPTTICNSGGVVGGGGGGGGGGGAGGGAGYVVICCTYRFVGVYAGGGGGGGGRTGLNNSGGGAGGTQNATPSGSAGSSGTSSSAGGGGSGGSGGISGCPPVTGTGGTGGTGGGWGSGGSGGPGGGGSGSCFQYGTSPSSGGGAGPATSGNSNITWSNTGTRYGPLG